MPAQPQSSQRQGAARVLSVAAKRAYAADLRDPRIDEEIVTQLNEAVDNTSAEPFDLGQNAA